MEMSRNYSKLRASLWRIQIILCSAFLAARGLMKASAAPQLSALHWQRSSNASQCSDLRPGLKARTLRKQN